MNWISRKIHLYNVTMGLYMLDWWERYLFNILIVVLLWFICYNTWRYATDFFSRWNQSSWAPDCSIAMGTASVHNCEGAEACS